LISINILLEKSDQSDVENSMRIAEDLPYDLISRPYYVDSIAYKLDGSFLGESDSEQEDEAIKKITIRSHQRRK
jgi:hypothetical protein